MIRCITLAATLLLLPCVTAGDVIDFSVLTGNNSDVFTSVDQGNFSVDVLSGDWFEAHLFGSPVPSIFGNSETGSVIVTENTSGLFTWQSVDLADAGAGGFDFEIAGLLNGDVVQFFDGSSIGNSFFSVSDPLTVFQPLDQLVISINSSTTSYNIDNIVVNTVAVPEPTSAFLCLGLVLAAAIRRTR